VRLIGGGLLLLFVVGIGLIYFFYGSSAALTGLICLLVGVLPLVLIWLGFYLLEIFTKKVRER
jgi:hypothetical protein